MVDSRRRASRTASLVRTSSVGASPTPSMTDPDPVDMSKPRHPPLISEIEEELKPGRRCKAVSYGLCLNI